MNLFLLQASTAKVIEDTEKEHEYSALNTLLFCFLMALCVCVGYLLKKYKFYYLPESAAVMGLGCIAGGIVKAVNPSQEEMSFLSFKPEIFFFSTFATYNFRGGIHLK